jgi:hypothetical protein
MIVSEKTKKNSRIESLIGPVSEVTGMPPQSLSGWLRRHLPVSHSFMELRGIGKRQWYLLTVHERLINRAI